MQLLPFSNCPKKFFSNRGFQIVETEKSKITKFRIVCLNAKYSLSNHYLEG